MRKSALIFSPLCLSLAWLLAGGCQRASDAPAVSPAKGRASDASAPTGSEIPAADARAAASGVSLQLLDYDGVERLVASHRGQVVVMDAWATSCPPCVREFPKLVALSRKFGRDQLACISLSFDYEGIGRPEDKAQRVTKFLEQQDATFDNVLASEESDALYRKFHLASVPAVFVYDKAGTLRHRFDNEEAGSEAEHFTYEDVERLVAELVAEPGPAEPAGKAP